MITIYWCYTKKVDTKSWNEYNKKEREESMMKVPKYTEEFKKTVIEIYKSGKQSSEIIKEFGISASVFYKWVKKYSQVKMPDGESISVDEIKVLQKRLAALEEENLILKKTLSIFARA